MAIYRVKLNLQHNGAVYQPGTVVELSEEQAVPLLGEVLEPVEEEVARKEDEAKPKASTATAKGNKPTKASKKDEADDL
jgi:hypothetical protein